MFIYYFVNSKLRFSLIASNTERVCTKKNAHSRNPLLQIIVVECIVTPLTKEIAFLKIALGGADRKV